MQAALALKASGMQVKDIAAELGVDRKSIQRYTQESEAAAEVVESALKKLNNELEPLLTVKRRAEEYASLATTAKNEAVRLGTLQRIDDLAGIVTEKELVRSKRNEPASPQALFMLPPGTSISFSATTTRRDTDTKTIDVSAGDIDTSTIDNKL